VPRKYITIENEQLNTKCAFILFHFYFLTKMLSEFSHKTFETELCFQYNNDCVFVC